MENPLLRFQFRKLLRYGFFLWLFLPWMALNMALRAVPDLLMTATGYGIAGVWMFVFIGFIIRADNFAVIFLLWYLLPGRDWGRLREDLRVTHISPRELVRALATAPRALLVVYNLLAARFVYDGIVSINILGMFVKSTVEDQIFVWSLFTLATLEDCLFCAICVLAALWARLDIGRATGSAAVRGLLITAAAGVVIASFSLIANLFDSVIPVSTSGSFSSAGYMSELLDGVLLLAMEAGIIIFLHRKCVKAAEQWLRAE